MTDLVFNAQQAREAIALADSKERDWLYRSYPKPDGQMRKSSTGFLMYKGDPYPVKPLGRLANEIAGAPMTTNPVTDVFRRHFHALGFQLIDSLEDEANDAVKRQRRLAESWERPGQAKFRRKVFATFGARCLLTGCDTLLVLEAAHVLPVADGGCDEAWNGLPLRADIHRLFDAGKVILDQKNWTTIVMQAAGEYYRQYNGRNLAPLIESLEIAPKLAIALSERASRVT